MCGIYGIVRTHHPVYERELIQMGNVLTHRGPDADGYFIDHNVGFGHKRLSIIDLAAGKQPMTNEDETIWLIFNGCIYNYREIRQQLEQRGHHFKTNSDTEVIIHAYEEYGRDCVHHFNGMFSFVIWDARKREIYAARDRFGVKPFYYAIHQGEFIFASEIKAILAYVPTLRQVNPDGLQDYFIFQYTLGAKTLFHDVKKLEPGHYMSFRVGDDIQPRLQAYWDYTFNYDFEQTEADFVEQVQSLIQDAVKIRLRSDVPLGSHLSGGLDSSAIVCVAASLMNGQSLQTFTGSFKESAEYDETAFAKRIAQHTGALYHEIIPSSGDFAEHIEDIIYYLDEPGAGPGVFPQYMVSKVASRYVKVVLGGQGGDEIFGGYARYLVAYLEECLKGAIYENADRGNYVVTLNSIIPNLHLLQNYQPMLQHFFSKGLFRPQDERYYHLIDRSEGTKSFYQIDSIFANSSYSVFAEFQAIFNKSNASSLLDKMLYYDVKASLPALLHVEDRTSMAASLESRLPLLDYRIIEQVGKIPPILKFNGGKSKSILKQAMSGIIPTDILERKDKMGFPVPLHEWFRDDLHGFVKEILLDPRTERRGIYNLQQIEQSLSTQSKYSRIMWGLLCLELWFRKFID